MATPAFGRRVRLAFAIAFFGFLVAPAHADLNPQLAPCGNFDLSHWKLTLPVDADGGITGTAAELTPAQLQGAPAYSSGWFSTAPDGGLHFWAPANGAKTGNTDYARSELRELLNPADDNQNWSSTTNSVLDARLAINAVPASTLKVVVGQIHGFGTGPLVKLRYQYSTSSKTGKLDALLNTTPTSSSTTSYPLATGIALNQSFYYHVTVSNGVLSMSVNGATATKITIDPSWAGTGFYFKAGVYDQGSGTSSSDGGAVTFYRLAATHPDNKIGIVTSTLSDATAGASYALGLAGSGGTGGGLWSMLSGTLPAGLVLDSLSGMLSGTPASGGSDSHQFTVQYRDDTGDTVAKTYTLNIAAP